jgi:hypothetical protein
MSCFIIFTFKLYQNFLLGMNITVDQFVLFAWASGVLMLSDRDEHTIIACSDLYDLYDS